jgi:hypothetical protein
VLILRGLWELRVSIRVIVEGLRVVRAIERPNAETSEGLNVEKQKRVEPCRKKKEGEDGIRYTRESIAHLNEDVKCFTWLKMRVERLLG